MQRVRAAAPQLAGLAPYDPHYLPARVYLNANESPYGLPARAVDELRSALGEHSFNRYPDPLAKALRARLAETFGLDGACVLLGNGGDELLFDILLAYGGNGRKLLIAPPSFSSYEIDARLTNTTLVELPRVRRGAEAGSALTLGIDEPALLERVSCGDIDVVMLASPNNPTGDALSEEFVCALLDASDALVVMDQAYVEFADARFDMTGQLKRHSNLALLRTFSKAWALAGIRLGYLLASAEVTGELCRVRQPYSVDSFSALAGVAVLNAADEIAARTAEARLERARVARALAGCPGVRVYRSEANFILFEVAGAHGIWRRLYDDYGILLRDFSQAPLLTDCLRVSIGTPEENDGFLEALRACQGGCTNVRSNR
jgi:histidinol-phosphate aminotransferase